ncbi:hypothetical protein K1719_039349 [Acacia pycnantha]|nr:hypothetical protein K1719_039349 [Acacia pycnantha]
MEKRNPCIAMVPCPGFSHLAPLIEFAKRLAVHLPHFHFTFLIPTLGLPSPAAHSILQSLLPHIDFIFLPHSSLSSHTQLVAIIADVFSVDGLEIAKHQFNLKSYVYFPMAVTTLCFCPRFPELDEDHEMVSSGFRDLSQPFKIPGCVVFQGKDLFDTVQERSSESHKTILHLCKRFDFADSIIANRLQELEPEPRNSVLFVSFGSGGTLSLEQLHELALGLEMSGHKFLWVVRAPSESSSSAHLSSKQEGPLDYLPKGFIDRTNDQGLVVPSWAPQIEVLKHESTGGVLTHCGWNSMLESIVHGKPMIVWPLFAEQRMNAVLITEELKIAVMKAEKSEQEFKFITKDTAAKTISEDGSSTKTLSCLSLEWKI